MDDDSSIEVPDLSGAELALPTTPTREAASSGPAEEAATTVAAATPPPAAVAAASSASTESTTSEAASPAAAVAPSPAAEGESPPPPPPPEVEAEAEATPPEAEATPPEAATSPTPAAPAETPAPAPVPAPTQRSPVSVEASEVTEAAPVNMSVAPLSSFEVNVKKETFKFHAAHFVAFQGFRERLHGHNYKMGVRIEGSHQIRRDGYVVDFGDIKVATKFICKELNEHFLCPMRSDVLTVTVGRDRVDLKCSVDGAEFSFPRSDCVLLPIAHATTEELAVYLWSRLLEELDASFLWRRGVHTMSITVEEAVGQEATFRRRIPQSDDEAGPLDVLSFIADANITPRPCVADAAPVPAAVGRCPPNCENCTSSFSEKLSKIAAAMNNDVFTGKKWVTTKDLEKVLKDENVGGKKRAPTAKPTAAKRSTTSKTKSTPAKRSSSPTKSKSTPAKRSASPAKTKSTPTKSSATAISPANKKAKRISKTPTKRFDDVWSFLKSSGWTCDQRNQQKYFFPPGVTRENGRNRVHYFDSMPLAFRHAMKKMPDSKEIMALEKKYPSLMGKSK